MLNYKSITLYIVWLPYKRQWSTWWWPMKRPKHVAV